MAKNDTSRNGFASKGCRSGCCAGDSSVTQAVGCSCCGGDKAESAALPADTGAVSPVEGGAAVVTETYDVAGMDCGDCAAKLEKAIRKLKGVHTAQVIFASAKMKVVYDRTMLDSAAIMRTVSGFGYTAEPVSTPAGGQTTFRISGLDCADCAAKLEKRLLALNGVQAAQVNFATSKLTITHTLSDSAIITAVQQAGYSAVREDQGRPVHDDKAGWRSNRRTQATLVSGVILGLALLAERLGVSEAVAVSLFIAAAVTGGYHAAKSGLYGLRSLSLDMNFLMTVAVVGAGVIGEWSEAATVAFLFSFGNTLQTFTMDKTRQSIRALMDLAPPEALVRRDGREQKLPVEAVAVGDIIIVKPGERIAMDGIVRTGLSAVNQATITGESVPVEKTVGDTVYAGTVNEHGALEVEVTKLAADSTFAKIMHLVEEAQAQKAPSQQFVDVFAKYYTPAVLLAALGVMVVPWAFFGQPFAAWFYKGLVLLVISCPCALVISTPVSIVAAIGNSSRNGVLIKGGAYLEQMGSIQAVAFDKTGTLTYGRPVVTDLAAWNGITEQELLTVAASVESLSDHPLARAIVDRAKGLPLKPVTNAQALVGRGAQADIDGQTFYIGNLRLFEELGLEVTQLDAATAGYRQQGKTVMLLGTGETVLGLIAVADTLRHNSAKAIEALHNAGLRHVAMLTGDNRQVAGSIAAELKLDAFYSELLPEDKVSAIRQMSDQYGSVAMVGDGVNDAPALAIADIGIAMGVAGSDTALETADIALMADDLGKLAYLIRLSRKTVAVIKQNIGFSIAIKAVFLLLTFAGYVNLWLAVFADMGSSILVTLNGMRLMRRLR